MPIAIRPVDISGIQGALAQLGSVRREQAMADAARRQRREQMQAALVGAAAGAAGGYALAPAGMEATLALQGAGVGAQGGGAIQRGDPVGVGLAALQGAGAYQGAQQLQQQRQGYSALNQTLLAGEAARQPPPVVGQGQGAFAPTPQGQTAAQGARMGLSPSQLQTINPQALAGVLQAVRPPAPQISTAAPGSTVLVDGQPTVTVPDKTSGFTLGPGQSRYDASGKLVIEGPPAGNKEGVREAKIRDLMTQWNLPRGDAVEIADGIKRIEITEAGFARLVNTRTGNVSEIPLGGSQQAGPSGASAGPVAVTEPSPRTAPAPGTPPTTLWEAAGSSAGIVPTVQEYWAKIAGQVPGAAVMEGAMEAVDARTMFRLAGQELTRALSNNRRFPVTERRAIEEMTEIEPSAFDSPVALRARLRALDQRLATSMANQTRIANDANQPTDVRSDAKSAVEEMRNFRALIGVPGGQGIPQPSPPPGTAMAGEGAKKGALENPASHTEYGALPSGAYFTDPQGNVRRKP